MLGAAEGHLLGWCAYTEPTFTMPNHIDYLADALMRVESGETKRLLVQMPPRSGKSLLGTIKFPAWFLGRNPNKRVIIAAHTADLSWSFSRLSRNDFREFGKDVFNKELAADSKAINSWSIRGHKGGLFAAGVGGPLTGKGGDVIIIDDPLKDEVAASSKLQRDRIWSWYTQVARTRLQPGGSIIIVMTRWHQDDIVGRVLANDPEGWETISFPAMAFKNDQLGRKEGEALWPERFPVEELEAIKKDVGDYAFSALYQQSPAPPSGSIIKKEWIKHYEDIPESFDKMIQTWDLSTKATDSGSYMVGQVWGKSGPDRYLLDQYRARGGFMEAIKAIRFMCKKWKEAKSIYIEEKACGPAVIQVLKKEISGVIAFNPRSSKEDRLRACEPLFQAGNILFPSKYIATWVNDLSDEVTSFPFSQYDDQTDCLSMAQDRFGSSGFDYSNMSINSEVGTLSKEFDGYGYAKR